MENFIRFVTYCNLYYRCRVLKTTHSKSLEMLLNILILSVIIDKELSRGHRVSMTLLWLVTYSNFISYCCLLYPQRTFHYVHCINKLKRIIVVIISHFAFPPKSNGILTNWNMCCFINIIQCNYSVVNTHLKTVDPVE